MSYFASMAPNDIWRAKELIARYPKRLPYMDEGSSPNQTLELRYDHGVPPPPLTQTMEFRYDRDSPGQTVPLSTNDAWRARALIAEYPAQNFGAEAGPSSKDQMDEYFRSLGGSMPPSPELDEGIQEGTPIDGPAPTFQNPGEIQALSMDDMYDRLADAQENYQQSRSGLERAGDYAAESANDFARSMANAATRNYADKISAALDSTFINDEDYETNLARQREETEQARERSPIATGAGVVAGVVASRRIRKALKGRLGPNGRTQF